MIAKFAWEFSQWERVGAGAKGESELCEPTESCHIIFGIIGPLVSTVNFLLGDPSELYT